MSFTHGFPAPMAEAQSSYPGPLPLATADAEGNIMVWNVRTGSELCTINNQGERIVQLCFSPDGERLIVLEPSRIRIHASHAGEPLTTFTPKLEPPVYVFTDPGGQRFATIDGQGRLLLWTDPRNSRYLGRVRGHTTSLVRQAFFSPDGQRIATASLDGTARVWEVATGRELRRFDHAGRETIAVDFSADSRQVLTASLDGLFRRRDAAHHEQRAIQCGRL
jgi:WD40 repeat protein